MVNTDLPAIYCQSELFLYPSLRESFGLPMLEAMACGVPVITSSTSSMPEVAGAAAFIIDPLRPAEITDAMMKICENSTLRSGLIQKGFIQAAKFSWKAMAQDVLKIYNETVNTDLKILLMTILKILFWVLLFIVFYTYLGYGILLYIVVLIRRKAGLSEADDNRQCI